MSRPVSKFISVPFTLLLVLTIWAFLAGSVISGFQLMSQILEDTGANVQGLLIGLSLFIVAILRDEQLKNRASSPLTSVDLR